MRCQVEEKLRLLAGSRGKVVQCVVVISFVVVVVVAVSLSLSHSCLRHLQAQKQNEIIYENYEYTNTHKHTATRTHGCTYIRSARIKVSPR